MKKILVIGSLNMDFSIKTSKIPVPGETVIGDSFNLTPGGKGANQAFAIGKLGCDVSMMGMLGNDEYANILIDNLKSVSVNTEGIKIKDDINTGVAFVTVDKNGENNIIVISGANSSITKDFIDENINLIKEADIIVMQLEIPILVVSYVAMIAKKYNKTVVLDPAPAKYNLPEELYKNIDIIKPNETELQILTNTKFNNSDDIINSCKLLIEKGVNNVVVTLGSKGSILVNKEIVKRFNAMEVDAVDTTAAALVTYLALDKSLEESIEFAHIASSITVTKMGAQNSIPSIDEVNMFLKNRK